MKTMISAIALAAALGLSSGAFAQDVPANTPDAKGNAPLKHAHTVNAGGAKAGHTSFTENEARKHIVHAGYDSVTGLTKGKDGVWRGVAMKNGESLNVGLDFKGNVSEGGTAMASPAMAPTGAGSAMTPSAAPSDTAGTTTTTTKVAAAGHRRHRGHAACSKTPGPNGVACSGVDRNENGISDKEDRAMKAGAKP